MPKENETLARLQKPLRGKFRAKSRLTIDIIRCDGSVVPGLPASMGRMSVDAMGAHTVAPVTGKLEGAILLQETAPEWDRRLTTESKNDASCFHPPILVSARRGWYLQETCVEILDRAAIVDGARRLEAALRFQRNSDIPFIVVGGLTIEAELDLRHQVQANASTLAERKEFRRVGTEAPRLAVGSDWVTLEIRSQPFVMPTFRGYAPAILVRRRQAVHSEHLLIGASSLAKGLMDIQSRLGTLEGVRISVRKRGEERIAPYELREEK